jgi:hypothetical protein
MNIKIVNWPINNVGGIVTLVVALQDALRQTGADVQVLHVSENMKMKVSAVDTATEIAGEFRSIRTSPQMQSLLSELNSADLVIFAHPSPHPNKDQVSKVGGGVLWQEVYRGLTTQSVVLIHDNMWEKTNAWFADVSDCVTHIFCCQKLFTESMSRYPGSAQMTWAYHPMKIDLDVPIEHSLKKRQKSLMMHTQWVQWKKHKLLIPMLASMCVQMDLYNSGIEYYYGRKTDAYKDFVTDFRKGAHGKARVAEKAFYHDVVPHATIRHQLRRVLGGVDFSSRGYVNYTHWEPLAHGAASFTHEDVLAHPTCVLPRDALVIPFNYQNFPDQVDNFLCMPDSEFIERSRIGTKFCLSKMTPEAVAKQLLEFVAP